MGEYVGVLCSWLGFIGLMVSSGVRLGALGCVGVHGGVLGCVCVRWVNVVHFDPKIQGDP